MKKLLLASVTIGFCGIGTAGLAADLPAKAALTPVPAAFAWTGCYAGASGGGGLARKQVTDPVQLVQDGFLGLGSTVGSTTVQNDFDGFIIGGQFGCDYQFAGNWVVGVEGAVAGSGFKGTATVPLPLGNPADSVAFTTRADIISSATARLGYSVDRWLFYVDGGAAWVGDNYSAAGVFLGTPFNFQAADLRNGWTVGVGAEWALWHNWSALLQYDYYDFGTRSVLMSDATNVLSGPVDIKQTVQTIKLGVNFHMWSLGD